MASEVDICNTALSYLGDEAIVTAISPPDGSPQAAYCARYFGPTLNELLEAHTWGFTVTRATLALLATNPSGSAWQYAYASPSNVLNFLAVEDPNVSDDYSTAIPLYNTTPYARDNGLGVYSPQPFAVETDANGNGVILTNQINAVLRYTQAIADTTKFSPLFTEALARRLAYKLSGPIIRGADGRREAQAQYQAYLVALEAARESDSNQRKLDIRPGAPWLVNR